MKYAAPTLTTLALMLTAVTLTACADAPSADTATKTLADAAETVAAPNTDETIAAIPSGTYVMDKTHGYVTFEYLHQGYSRPTLRFNDVDAVLTLDSETPTNSSVTVTINAESIDTGVAKFDEHIKNADMFDVANHPVISFTSTSLTQSDSANGTLTGDLTLKGITKPFTLAVTFNKSGISRWSKLPMAGFSATGTLLRSEWDMGYAVPAVGDEVQIRVEAEFNTKPPAE